MTALQLYGVTSVDGEHPTGPVPDTELVAFRDLGAVASETAYARSGLAQPELGRYREVVEGVFAQRAILPAPPGVVFRSRETLLRWMELHYVVLADGLSFVDGRCVGRVHLWRSDEPLDAPDADLTSATAESFRALRRQAVAAVPLKTEHDAQLLLSSSFLVPQERWEEFREAVGEEQARHSELRYELTGPWPPYDFVQMHFGG